MQNEAMEHAMQQEMMSVAERLTAAAGQLERVIAGMEERHAHVCGDVQRIVATAEGAFEGQRDASRQELERKLVLAEQALTQLQAQIETGSASTGRKTVALSAAQMFSKGAVESGSGVQAGAVDAALSGLSLEQRIAVKSQLARAGLLS